MTAATRGDCVTEPSRPQRSQGSTSHDQGWADFLRSYSQSGPDPTTSSDNIGFGLFGVDDSMHAQFGAMNDFQDQHDAATTINNSLPSSIYSDPNGAPHSFQPWPVDGHAPLMAYDHTPFHPGPWVPELHHHYQPQHYDHGQPTNFGMPGPEGLGIHMPPTSHPIEAQHAMHFGGPFIDHNSPIAHHHHDDLKHDMTMPPAPPPIHDNLFAGEDEDREASADPADPCYAQLLYQCLKEAPGHTLSLRELYEWVQQHSQKAKDPKNRGWQNSVRHNLSMNAVSLYTRSSQKHPLTYDLFKAFQRVPHSTATSSTHLPKKGSLWHLTDEALRTGVISTTRYRKDPKRKLDTRRAAPALNRQTSGAKGGRATRDATRARQRERERRAKFDEWRSTSPPGTGVGTPASPYFGYPQQQIKNGQPQQTRPVGMPYEMLPTSAPQTPPEWSDQYQHRHLNPFHHHQQMMKPPRQFGLQPHTAGGTFEFLPLDMGQGMGLFGNSDEDVDFRTPTPSLMTEGSSGWGEEVGGGGDQQLLPPSSVIADGEAGF